MRKIIKWTAILMLFICLVSVADAVKDRKELRDSLIRLHVVGASDAEEDQRVKLRVRDAVIFWLEEQMADIHSVEQAKAYLASHLNDITKTANQALLEAGVSDTATVSFMEEAFPLREYDTFSLPSGVYQSLRIRIGEAAGRNWWCVVFPSLCLGATTEEMRDTAVSAGMDAALTDTLTGKEGYELHFFIMDCIGKLENFFHAN